MALRLLLVVLYKLLKSSCERCLYEGELGCGKLEIVYVRCNARVVFSLGQQSKAPVVEKGRAAQKERAQQERYRSDYCLSKCKTVKQGAGNAAASSCHGHQPHYPRDREHEKEGPDERTHHEDEHQPIHNATSRTFARFRVCNRTFSHG